MQKGRGEWIKLYGLTYCFLPPDQPMKAVQPGQRAHVRRNGCVGPNF